MRKQKLINTTMDTKGKNTKIITIKTMNIREDQCLIDLRRDEKLITEEENHHLDHKVGDAG